MDERNARGLFRRLKTSTALLIGMAVLINASSVGAVSTKADRKALKPWTIETSVNTRYFIDPNVSYDPPTLVGDPARPILPSPDGRHFAIVSRQGDLTNDVNIFELSVFDTQAVRDAVAAGGRTAAPVRSLSMRSAFVDAPIAHLEWTSDGNALRFSGVQNHQDGNIEHSAFYEWRPLSGNLQMLCPCGQQPATYQGGGNRLLDASEHAAIFVRDSSPPVAIDVTYPAQIMDAAAISRLRGLDRTRHFDLFAYAAGQTRAITLPHGTSAYGAYASINPQGDAAIVALRQGGNNISSSDSWRLIRIDLANGAMRELSQRSIGSNPSIVWSRTGNRAIVFWVGPGANTTPSIIEIDTRSGDIQDVATIQAGRDSFLVSWGTDDASIVMEKRARDKDGRSIGPALERILYVRGANGWTRSADAPAPPPSTGLTWEEPRSMPNIQEEEAKALHQHGVYYSYLTFPPPQPFRFSNGLSLILGEGPNQPQRIIAEVGARRATLIDVQPMLRNVDIAPSQIVEWRTADGQSHRGLLTLPRQRLATPPPLVVMHYVSTFNVFRPDGPYYSAYARQPLVARGMAVLETSLQDCTSRNQTEWIACNTEHIDAAIDSLAARNIIDVRRMGLIGFSQAGFQARTILVHPARHRFQAVAVNDSNSATWSRQLGAWATTEPGEESKNDLIDAPLRGGRIWEAQSRWMDEAMDLAANHATGALLETIHDCDDQPNPAAAVALLNPVIGSMRSARRPVEAVCFGFASHNIQRPRQRFASLSFNVDWMDFWLMGHEDPGPSKAEQYRRWRKMRDVWVLQQAWEAAGNIRGSKPSDAFAQSFNAAPVRAGATN